MNEWENSNYSDRPWNESFVGVEKLGGTTRGKSKNYSPKCYVVRVPMMTNKSRAIKKCQSREEAEATFREYIRDWQGRDWQGDIPFRDKSYIRKR